MDSFTIKDLENLSGIKAHTIRIWEQRYSFLKPQRTGTNIRYYTNEELKKLLNVALLNKYGYKISHIDRMTDEQISERIFSLTQSEAVQERILNDLVTYIVDINMTFFEELLDNYIASRGIEKAITQIIFPLLEKTGILWLTGSIIPAQEHLVSNIIRQKFIMGIENTRSHVRLNKTALLFLPEDEHHEIGLLYMQYQFKSRGFNVLYIGADTPLTDIGYIAALKNPILYIPTLFHPLQILIWINFWGNSAHLLPIFPLLSPENMPNNIKKARRPMFILNIPLQKR